jgi:hypothetical protein
MTQSELVDLLQHNVVSVTFIKVDGTERTMPCTLDGALIPPPVVVEGHEARAKKANPAVVSVWCTDAAGWRSFRWDNFVSASVIKALAV